MGRDLTGFRLADLLDAFAALKEAFALPKVSPRQAARLLDKCYNLMARLEGKAMIVRTKKGFKVTSEDGTKNLSADNLTLEEAHKRLAEVEYFKKKRGKK